MFCFRTVSFQKVVKQIDEQTLEDSRELIKAEIEVNGGDLIDFYNSFTDTDSW